MPTTIEIETKDRIRHIRLNRVKQMNSLSFELMDELSAALREADADDDIHVVVLGHNGAHFGAGYDLNADWEGRFGRKSAIGARNMLRACAAFEFAPWDCSKPVIAMVRGYCLAGSCELAMMCCVTFASETAMFGEPEIRFSAAPPVVVMPWLIGLKKARELLYSGELIDADEALRLGMINHVLPGGELEAATLKYARLVAQISLEGLKTTKAAINKGAEIAGLRAAIDYGVETGALLDSTPTEVYVKFSEIIREEGLSAAIRWRESQFEE
ncbi:MAG: enoyl-CoA hydratase/isomerase family protein [Alphaproteobacteria bacterium]|jgi:enoyl-CoA hydratase|nr:enoyl-CoA hydratase/isomerase family protein [Alphaproteobacteria bacterium]